MAFGDSRAKSNNVWVIRYDKELVGAMYFPPYGSVDDPQWTPFKTYAARFKTKKDAMFFVNNLKRQFPNVFTRRYPLA